MSWAAFLIVFGVIVAIGQLCYGRTVWPDNGNPRIHWLMFAVWSLCLSIGIGLAIG